MLRAATIFPLLLLTLFGATPRSPTRPAAQPVEVTVLPAIITRQAYRAESTPPGLQITADELGVCATQFGCTAQIRAQWTTSGEATSPATLTWAAITTRITIEIWTLEGSAAAVAAHEETHRAISEHYYARAGEIARRLGEAVIGKTVPMSGKGRQAQPEMEAIERELVAAFMWETSSRSEYAQRRFDVITDHGRNMIDNRVGMARALEEEQAHWEKVKHQRPPEKATTRRHSIRR